MTTGDHRQFQVVPALLGRMAHFARLWRKRRRERAELAHWGDERDLRDAGTRHAALECEFAGPFWRE